MANDSQKIRMAQYGTKHSHAPGVLKVTLANKDVDFVGVYEPDRARREKLEKSGEKPWSDVKWIDDVTEILTDSTIKAISAEGDNSESLDHTEKIVTAGKHVFLDKPAGDDYARFQNIVTQAKESNLLIQLGYMFRYHDGFSKIAEWAKSGFLGHVFSIRGNMSTTSNEESRIDMSMRRGGIFYDLACHMLDQIVWILGRPLKVTSFLRQDDTVIAKSKDNTLGVFEYGGSIATVDIAAIEPAPCPRRFEVYGTNGWVTMEPFEPADTLRLCLRETNAGYPAGISTIKIEARPRYVASLEAFIKDIRGEKQPDRTLDHELLVQETLLRATGSISEHGW